MNHHLAISSIYLLPRLVVGGLWTGKTQINDIEPFIKAKINMSAPQRGQNSLRRPLRRRRHQSLLEAGSLSTYLFSNNLMPKIAERAQTIAINTNFENILKV
jgi:hypothetical protein